MYNVMVLFHQKVAMQRLIMYASLLGPVVRSIYLSIYLMILIIYALLLCNK